MPPFLFFFYIFKSCLGTLFFKSLDDYGFWPATPESIGVNAWVALDDMPLSMGGGFALSTGSHVAPWRHEAYGEKHFVDCLSFCYFLVGSIPFLTRVRLVLHFVSCFHLGVHCVCLELTGASMTIPEEGFQSAADMFENRKGAGTCNIKTVSPKLHDIMEQNKRVYDIKAGDVIFHTRWLFHRTIPFRREIAKEWRRHSRERSRRPLLYRRYSVRYVPGSARLPKG